MTGQHARARGDTDTISLPAPVSDGPAARTDPTSADASTSRGGEFQPEVWDRPDWKWDQVQAAWDYLAARVDGGGAHDTTAVTRHAATILTADPYAPDMEYYDGIRYDTTVEGHPVKCRACKAKWTAIPEQPYYDGTTRADGLCLACVLKESRTDDAVPVLEGVVVGKRHKTLPAGDGAP